MIEKPKTLMGHPDLVDVGKDQQDVEITLGKSPGDEVDLAVDIPRWPFHAGKDPVIEDIAGGAAGI
jgi:hypothetical protein